MSERVFKWLDHGAAAIAFSTVTTTVLLRLGVLVITGTVLFFAASRSAIRPHLKRRVKPRPVDPHDDDWCNFGYGGGR